MTIKKKHIYQLSRIIKKAKIQIPATDDPKILGDVITTLVGSVGDVEDDIDKLLADIHEKPISEIRDMEFTGYCDLIEQVVKSESFTRAVDKLFPKTTLK